MLHYVSTRGEAPPRAFADTLLAGPAPDGGLYVPDEWPQLSHAEIAGLADCSYPEAAHRILSQLVDSFSSEELHADLDAAYTGFDGLAVAPLRQVSGSRNLLELFHGPTLAFKDIALRLLAPLFARELARRNTRATIVVATSGDTGSAAISAFGDLPGMELFVLHPHGRISEVQRRQMTTATFANVHNIAVEGTFDQAQGIVKALFADQAFAHDAHLTAVNSINFARIAAQTVYYFTTVARLGMRAPIFVVPTGNFGDVFAGECAMRMGLPVARLVIATNANDILTRTLSTGVYAAGSARQTLSPSMDIQVASNFERALFEASDRDAAWMRHAMADANTAKGLHLPGTILQNLRERYAAHAIDDDETLATIARVHRETGLLIDPHTAVAWAAADRVDASNDTPVVILGTAHPAKFPETVRNATGIMPTPPAKIAPMLAAEEHFELLPPDVATVRGYIDRVLPARRSPT
jgi:threonine synthase